MDNWKNYAAIPNRHELTLNDDSELVLHEYSSGYTLDIKYRYGNDKKPAISVTAHEIFQANGLKEAKVYAIELAKANIVKAIHQLTIACKQTDFYGTEPEPEEPDPFEDINPGSILWTDAVVTQAAIRQFQALHLMETHTLPKNEIYGKLKEPAIETLAELSRELQSYELWPECLMQIIEYDECDKPKNTSLTPCRSLDEIFDVRLLDAMSSNVFYFANGDLHYRTKLDSKSTHGAIRLVHGQNSDDEEKLEAVIRDALEA